MDGHATLRGLPSGSSSVFAVYNGDDAVYDNYGNFVSDGEIQGWSKYSKDITVTDYRLPAAPGNVYTWQRSKYAVVVDWTNTPSNETGFIVERQVNDGGFSKVYTARADETEYVDDLSALPNNVKSLSYRVSSINPLGTGAPSEIATFNVLRGGPDITANLNWMVGSVNATFATANTKRVAAGSDVSVAKSNLMRALINVYNGWDITGMAPGQVTNADQTLPETCTVNGGVYDESAVNYFLSGLVEVMMQKYDSGDAPLFQVLQNYVFLAHLRSSDPHDHPLEKLAWFQCGVQSAQAGSLTGVPPNYYPMALPNSEGPKPGHFAWSVEDLGTTDPN